MSIKKMFSPGLLALLLVLASWENAPAQRRQDNRAARAVANLNVLERDIDITIKPDVHELDAVATIKFTAAQRTGNVSFVLSNNLFVRRVLDKDGIELEFDQNQAGPETLSIRFSPPLPAKATTTLRIEYEGGFDSDRFSRVFSRNLTSAYIGMEGTRLMEAAKWFPAARYPAERAPGTLKVTVPLGMTVIGPGRQEPVITSGLNETFVWRVDARQGGMAFVAGQYTLKKITAGDFTLECFSRGNDPETMRPGATAAAKMLAWYRDAYGPLTANNTFRLVEVDDDMTRQSGLAGAIFITRAEVAANPVPEEKLARRVAAQWWTESSGASSPGDLWLTDGLSYYSAARYLGATAGAAALKTERNALAVLALKFEDKSSVRDALDLGYRSEAYESVIAGKGAWIINMLENILGEKKLDSLLKDYFTHSVQKGGSTAELQKLARELYGRDLNWFFTEWLDTIGVPDLQIDYVVYRTLDGFRVSGSIKQDNDLFRMPVEIGASDSEKEEFKTVELRGKSTSFDIVLFAMPQKIMVDPHNKILRDSQELRTAVQIALGDDLRRVNNYAEAVQAYDAALKLTPRRSLAQFRLGETFFEQANLQSSANAFRAALDGDRDPAWIEVWCYIYLGKIYDILGQRQRALAEYTRAINTKDDTNGAQAEAARWQAAPYIRSDQLPAGDDFSDIDPDAIDPDVHADNADIADDDDSGADSDNATGQENETDSGKAPAQAPEPAKTDANEADANAPDTTGAGPTL